ncbi:hypothetical protein LTR16_006900, partial [Cryomyces antarcticus]
AHHPVARGIQMLGGLAELLNTIARASVKVEDTSDLDGDEVVQLYVSFPERSGEPVRQLRGFERVHVSAGKSQTVDFQLQRGDLSIWDAGTQAWVLANGDFIVWFGKSSRHFEGSVTLNKVVSD